MKQRHLSLVALVIALAAHAAWAERTPPRAAALADDGNTRVIVRFKAGASLLRAHALGARSSQAAAYLLAKGFQNAVSLQGGMDLWQKYPQTFTVT